MKILLISHAKNDENAGASRLYHMMAAALRERGHQVTLYHYEDLRVPKFLNYFVLRMALPEFIFWRFFKEASQNYDVILHGLTYFDHLAVITERLRGHVKLSPFFMALKGRFPIRWDAEGAKYADAIVSQNLRDQDYLEDAWSQHPGDVSVRPPIFQVPSALHPLLEEACHQVTPPENRNPMSILWFGSWRERKGNYYVNRAFRAVKRKFPAATLTLGGTGTPAASVEAFFDPELRSSIRVLPRVDTDTQIREYNSHGIFIFPSLSEGFGLAPIEAMAMGLACVTTHTGVGSDWIEDGKHAVVVTMSSSEHLARGIVKLMEDDELRLRVAKEGRKLAQEFTLKRCISEYLDVFEKRAVSSSP
jgi:glycosyltransferase involved in cell wall biosynthesis